MAGAYIAQADDESSLSTNPAGLARLKGLSLGGSQLVGLLGAQATYLNVSAALANGSGLGLEFAYLYDQDSFRDAFGNESGSFNNSNWLLGLGLGFRVVPRWRLGVAAKALGETYGGSQSTALAGDLALQGPLTQSLRFGAALQNMGVQLGSAGPSYGLPMRIQAGISMPLVVENFRLNADLQGLPVEGAARALIGTELRFKYEDTTFEKSKSAPIQLAIRAGVSSPFGNFEQGRLAFGLGIEMPPTYSLDYALTSFGELGIWHRMSLAFRFPSAKFEGIAPPGAELSPVHGLELVETIDGIELRWRDPNDKSEGYNLYADFGVVVEKLNEKPVKKKSQKFTNIDRGKAYKFFIRPVGSDDKEGPPSEGLEYRYRFKP